MKIMEVTSILDALAQETRLKVFRILVKNSETGICPCEIAEELAIPRNTLSFHLSLLKQVGLCHQERQGKKITYKPNCQIINEVVAFLHQDCISCHLKSEKIDV